MRFCREKNRETANDTIARHDVKAAQVESAWSWGLSPPTEACMHGKTTNLQISSSHEEFERDSKKQITN